jgi:prepilin-type N-terminal cleavage/methylation domain-containing protein
MMPMRNQRGLTLVELMIAIALMLIMTLQLQLIFNQSRKLYLGADAMAQVYSNARAALDQIEKDVSNAIKTDQMEYFADRRTAVAGVGHYDTLPGGAGSEFLTQLRGKFVSGPNYIYGMAFKQPEVYHPKDKSKVGDDYRHDAMYFKTFTMVDGQPREALVEYSLYLGIGGARDPRPRPILQRIVTAPEIDSATGAPKVDAAGNPVLVRHPPQDMCYYVQEFRVELFLRDRREKSAGRFYSPKETLESSPAINDPFPPKLKNIATGAGQTVAIQCLDGKPEAQQNEAGLLSDADGKLYLQNGDRMSRTRPGDKLYLMSLPIGAFVYAHADRYLTVKEIKYADSKTIISFEEEEKIKQDIAGKGMVPVQYRSGWLPEAIRVQMKIKDQRSQEIRTLTRIFQLLRA